MYIISMAQRKNVVTLLVKQILALRRRFIAFNVRIIAFKDRIWVTVFCNSGAQICRTDLGQ